MGLLKLGYWCTLRTVGELDYRLRSRIIGMEFLKQINQVIQIRIASAELSCQPVSTTLGNSLAVGNYLKLTSLATGNHGYNAEALLDQGCETRNLCFVVLSGRTGNNLDLHSVL